MILTVTPNPTIDRALFVRNFRLGVIVRAEREVAAASGKGVDASTVIHRLGGQTVAIGLNAGYNGGLLSHLLDEEGIAHDFVSARGETRTAIVLVDKAVDKQSTISASTLWAEESHVTQLLERIDRYADRAWGVLFAGSLPAGVAPDTYSKLVAHARRLGLITMLDTSGEALRLGIGGQPHILKINEVELASLDAGAAELVESITEEPAGESTGQISGGAINMMRNLAETLRPRLGTWATDAIVITLGALGALAISTTGVHYARPPTVTIVNTAGAGDAVSGALLLALEQGRSWSEAMRLAMAAAAAVVMSESIAFQDRTQVDKLLAKVVEVQVG